MNYRKVNNITGWVVGGIAYIVYIMTMEPTVSFWDCGEFLSCAYKLEVGHSPGAPFFMLLQRFFALFAGGTLTGGPSTNAAAFINSLSVLTSALTNLFLFWTITYFAKRITNPDNSEPSRNQMIIIMGAGVVGALANTFSDTFWFSAVEAEVYGTSSFFTAITFWAVLKWERVADNKYADRWLVLIAYLIGVSVCVHLLNLLTIPAVVMVYYFKRFKPTYMGTFLAFLAGCVVLAFVQFGVIQYIPRLASVFDIMFTNNFGASFDVGGIVFLLLVSAILIFLVIFSKARKIYWLHTSALAVMFIIIGYSSYFAAIVRSRADVPIDMTNPDNPITFLDYVDRAQFGEQPIFFGPYYTSQPSEADTSEKIYAQTKVNGKDHYLQVGKNPKYIYKGDQLHFFPRVYEGFEARHSNFYKQMLNLGDGEEPSTADNLKYFFSYQMDWMWWRFFMWNFAGRQNDVEGQLDPQGGNWITGITFLDKMRGLGDTDKMGSGFSDNGAHNKLYLLPFILGVIGLVLQFNRNKKDGLVVMFMFFFTGAAIGIYLNMPPVQPRERDYAFAGCTYTFTIWIGLGVILVEEWLRKALKSPTSIYASVSLCTLAVPVLMCQQEWDDHDRSKKTLARAVAHNTLSCCPQNAVLFTYGDNQTYPLWYIQEVEGYRKDVRIINTSLLGIGWYVDQLNYRVNDADAIPMIWKWYDYVGDHHNQVRYYDTKKIPKNTYIPLEQVCTFLNSNDPGDKLQLTNGDYTNYMPTKNFSVPTPSKEELVKMGLVKAEDTSKITNVMNFSFPKDAANKSDLAILNMIAGIAKEGWKRPLCFDAGLRQSDYVGTGDYMSLDGLVYTLKPYKYYDSTRNTHEVFGNVNTDLSYNLYMHGYMWGGGERNDVYFDEPNRHEFTTIRMNVSQIANALIFEDKCDKADSLLNVAMKGITEHSYPYDFYTYFLTASYFRAGMKVEDARKNGEKYSNMLLRNIEDNVRWVNSLPEGSRSTQSDEVNRHFQVMQSLYQVSASSGDTTYAKTVMKRMQTMYGGVKDLLKTRTPQQGNQQQQEEE